ncbi:MAG: agmatinase [Thermoplasmata archaeon]
MPIENLLFADASITAEGCPIVLLGVPYDGTTTFRGGSRFGPNAIRQASYNFETYEIVHDVDLQDVHFCDLGNLDEVGTSEAMVQQVEAFARNQLSAGKITIMLGGEHSITAPCVGVHRPPAFVVLDAHMDFRESYLGDRNSHACVTRRVAEQLGVDRVLVVGVRSYSREEAKAVKDLGLKHITSFDILDGGLDRVLKALEGLPEEVYLSLDMDAIDPAYAPAVGNPEPFGLTPLHVKRIISALGERIVGFDVTEVSPPWDQGNTAALAARLVREVIAAMHRSGRA